MHNCSAPQKFRASYKRSVLLHRCVPMLMSSKERKYGYNREVTMAWFLFFIGTPVRIIVTCVVVLLVISVAWPGVVAHIMWVVLYAAVSGAAALVWELKWLLLLGGVGAGAYVYFRKFL